MAAKNKGWKGKVPPTGRGAQDECTMGTQMTPGEAAIMDSIAQLHAKFDLMERRLHTLETWKTETNKKLLDSEVAAKLLDRRVSGAETELQDLKSIVQDYSQFRECVIRSVSTLECKVEAHDLKLRAARIRVVGVPALSAGEDVREVMQKFLRESVLLDPMTQVAELAEAHRLPTKPPVGSDIPLAGTVLLVLARAADRALILSAASKPTSLTFRMQSVRLFLDVSQEVATRHFELRQLRRMFIDSGFEAAVKFPARLVVTWEGKTNAFLTSSSAASFLEAHTAHSTND